MKESFPEIFFASLAIFSYIYMEILYFKRVRPFLRKRHIEPKSWANNFGRITDYKRAKKEVKTHGLELNALDHIRILFIIYIFSFIGIAIVM
jgi:hypothetical protein